MRPQTIKSIEIRSHAGGVNYLAMKLRLLLDFV